MTLDIHLKLHIVETTNHVCHIFQISVEYYKNYIYKLNPNSLRCENQRIDSR